MATDNGATLQVKLGGETGSRASVDKGTGVAITAIKQLTEEGTLTIEADADGKWYKADDFRLTYIGSSLPESLTAISGNMNATVKSAMETAITTYNSSSHAIADYRTAMTALDAAITSRKAYASVSSEDRAAYKARMESLLANTNVYTTANGLLM